MVEVSYFLFPLPRRARGRPMIVARGSGSDRGKERKGGGWVEEGRRLLENCGHNSSRDRYYYRSRWNVSVAPRLQLCRMHLNSIHLRCVTVSKQRWSRGIAGFVKTHSRWQTSRSTLDAITIAIILVLSLRDFCSSTSSISAKDDLLFSHRENFSRIRNHDSYCFSFLSMLHLFIIQQSENIVYSFKTSRTLWIDW